MSKEKKFDEFVCKLRAFRLGKNELKTGLNKGEIEIIQHDLHISKEEIYKYAKIVLENPQIKLWSKGMM